MPRPTWPWMPGPRSLPAVSAGSWRGPLPVDLASHRSTGPPPLLGRPLLRMPPGRLVRGDAGRLGSVCGGRMTVRRVGARVVAGHGPGAAGRTGPAAGASGEAEGPLLHGGGAGLVGAYVT